MNRGSEKSAASTIEYDLLAAAVEQLNADDLISLRTELEASQAPRANALIAVARILLTHPRWFERSEAVETIGLWGSSKHYSIVLPCRFDASWVVRGDAYMALGRLATSRSNPNVLATGLTDPNPIVRSNACEGLRIMLGERAVSYCRDFLQTEKNPQAKVSALACLSIYGDQDALAKLVAWSRTIGGSLASQNLARASQSALLMIVEARQELEGKR